MNRHVLLRAPIVNPEGWPVPGMVESNSLAFWYPMLTDTAVPRSILVPIAPALYDAVSDGVFRGPLSEPAAQAVGAHIAAAETLGYPYFLRTDLTAAKHSGPSAYVVRSRQDARRALILTLQDTTLKQLGGRVRYIVVRELLDLDFRFSTRSGRGVGPEVRAFVLGGAADLRHYWAESALLGLDCRPADWPSRYQEMRAVVDHDMKRARIGERALRATEDVGGGDWSVDFARDKDGRWWLIDMALANQSWRPE